MHIELASTAGSYRRTDMLTMVMPSRISMARLAKKAVVEDMMTAPVKRYNSPPEISIFPAMLNEPGYFRKIFAEHIKKDLTLHIFGTYRSIQVMILLVTEVYFWIKSQGKMVPEFCFIYPGLETLQLREVPKNIEQCWINGPKNFLQGKTIY